MQEDPIMESDLSEMLLELALCVVLPYVLVAALDRVAGKHTVHPEPGSHQNGEPHS